MRERRLYVYPGVNKAGVGLVVLTGREITASAVGSIQMHEVDKLSERFNPTVIVVPPGQDTIYRSRPFRATFDSLRIVRPGWQANRSKRRFPVRDAYNLGPLAQNAWAMMSYEIMSDKSLKLRSWNMSLLSGEWLEQNSVRRFI
jgi:hypothetical protein